MSVNLELILEPEIEAAHPEGDIHLSLTYLEELDRLAKKLKIAPLSSFLIEGADEEFDEEPELFDAAAGLATLEALLKAVDSGSTDFTDAEETEILADELRELIGCLQKARKKKARFCFITV
jgi:hypothetical protein